MQRAKSELDKSVVKAWVGSPAQSQRGLFLEYPFPRKSVVMTMKKHMAEAVTRDMASSDWLKLTALCLLRAQSVSKNKSIVDCPGTRPLSDISTLLSLLIWNDDVQFKISKCYSISTVLKKLN